MADEALATVGHAQGAMDEELDAGVRGVRNGFDLLQRQLARQHDLAEAGVVQVPDHLACGLELVVAQDGVERGEDLGVVAVGVLDQPGDVADLVAGVAARAERGPANVDGVGAVVDGFDPDVGRARGRKQFDLVGGQGHGGWGAGGKSAGRADTIAMAPKKGKLGTQAPAIAQRFDRVDALRGLALLWMAAFHFCFDLANFRLTESDFYRDPFWTWQRTFILSTFLLCAGAGQAIATHRGQSWARFWRRWAQIVGCALLVSLGSWWMFPRSDISFGVLHVMAA